MIKSYNGAKYSQNTWSVSFLFNKTRFLTTARISPHYKTDIDLAIMLCEACEASTELSRSPQFSSHVPLI